MKLSILFSWLSILCSGVSTFADVGWLGKSVFLIMALIAGSTAAILFALSTPRK